jgi:hypothetical protein
MAIKRSFEVEAVESNTAAGIPQPTRVKNTRIRRAIVASSYQK